MALGVCPALEIEPLVVVGVVGLPPPPDPSVCFANRERAVQPASDGDAIADVRARALFLPPLHAGHFGLPNRLPLGDVSGPRLSDLRVVLVHAHDVESGPGSLVLEQGVAVVIALAFSTLGCRETALQRIRARLVAGL